MPTLLHAGCGAKRKDQTTRGFNTPEWHELRLDINPSVAPDVVGTMTDMADDQKRTPTYCCPPHPPPSLAHN